MSVIQKQDFFVAGERWETKVEFFTSTNPPCFAVRIPDRWSTRVDESEYLTSIYVRGSHAAVTSDTLAGVIDRTKKFFAEFETQHREEEPVLIFELDVSSPGVEEEDPDDDRPAYMRNRYHSEDERKITFSWEKAIKVTIGEFVEYIYEDEEETDRNSYYRNTPNTSGRQIIPWTEDREKFCRDFDDALDKLIIGLRAMLGTGERMIDTIAQGLQALPAGPEPKKKRTKKAQIADEAVTTDKIG